MINIRPVSDLRNKYPEIEELVLKEDEEEMSKEDLKKKFLDNYNSYDYENDAADEKPKRRHHKGKRFK